MGKKKGYFEEKVGAKKARGKMKRKAVKKEKKYTYRVRRKRWSD